MKLIMDKNLKDLLKDRYVTIAQLSRAMGIAQQSLNNWMADLEPRSMIQVKKVENYFKVSVDWFAYGEKFHTNEPNFNDFKEEINAGIFKVILRRTK